MSILDSGPIASLLSSGVSGPAPSMTPESQELDKMKALSLALSNLEDPSVIVKMMADDAQKKLTRQQEILAILKELNGSGQS